MNLKDTCAEEGITLAEGKEKYGLTHWNQTVAVNETESQEEVAPAVEEIVEKPLVTKAEVVAPKVVEAIDPKLVELSIRSMGNKSPYWK